MIRISLAAAAVALALGGIALAQQHQHGAGHPTQGPAAAGHGPGHRAPGVAPQGHGAHGQPGAPASSPAARAFEAANARMHKDMAVALTGNADVDFARSMIPHHRGAVDMARIVLEHGRDPEIRKLAQEVIAAQEKEIAMLEGWLKKHGP